MQKSECYLSPIGPSLDEFSWNEGLLRCRLELNFPKDERPRSLGGFSGKWNNIGRLEIDEIPNLIIRSFLVGVIDASADFANQAEAEELHA
jgi:hypothetical protein